MVGHMQSRDGGCIGRMQKMELPGRRKGGRPQSRLMDRVKIVLTCRGLV